MLGFQTTFTINTLDHPFFPKQGVSFFTEYRRRVAATEDILFQDFSFLSLIANSYDKLQVGLKALIPIHKKVSLLVNNNIGITSTTNISSEITVDSITIRNPDENIKLFSDYYHIGGVIQRSRVNAVPFWGIKENRFQGSNFATLQIGIQYEIFHNLFITPSVNTLYITDNNKDFLKNVTRTLFKNKYDNASDGVAMYTYSLNIGYKTLLGPILLNISKASIDSGITAFLSIGYSF
jgi:NTE family protein